MKSNPSSKSSIEQVAALLHGCGFKKGGKLVAERGTASVRHKATLEAAHNKIHRTLAQERKP